MPALALIEDEAAAVEIEDGRVTVTLKGGAPVSARLAIGADGRRSLCRAAAGIATDARSYPQTALTCNLAHDRPHHDTSTELHAEPAPSRWCRCPATARAWCSWSIPPRLPACVALSDAEMAEEIERRSHSILGKVAVEPGRGVFPLAIETARHFGARRVALIGEAAHVIPPIGAQGLNLGLRDAATIAELVVAAHRDGERCRRRRPDRAL